MSIRNALNKAPTGDPFLAFLPVEADIANDQQYIGFMTVNGAWMIKSYNNITGESRYVGDHFGFKVAWADRVNLTYTYPDVLEKIRSSAFLISVVVGRDGLLYPTSCALPPIASSLPVCGFMMNFCAEKAEPAREMTKSMKITTSRFI